MEPPSNILLIKALLLLADSFFRVYLPVLIVIDIVILIVKHLWGALMFKTLMLYLRLLILHLHLVWVIHRRRSAVRVTKRGSWTTHLVRRNLIR